MDRFRGYLFAKLFRIGSKSEGPEYFLQQWNKQGETMDLPIEKKEDAWHVDKVLHQFLGQKVEILGTRADEKLQYDKIAARESVPKDVDLESMYLDKGFKWGKDDRLAHGVAFRLREVPEQEKFIGTLALDPNTSTLNNFGDLDGGTKMAVQSFDVTLTRMRCADPLDHGRLFYSVIGDNAVDGMAVVTLPGFRRCHLKLDQQIVPLRRRRP